MLEHIRQVHRHRVRPEEVMVESRVRVDSFGRVKSEEFVQQFTGTRVLDVVLQTVADLNHNYILVK